MQSICDDLSKGVENVQICVDLGELSREHIIDFVYVRKNIPGPGTPCDKFSDEFEGCECKAVDEFDEECTDGICACLHGFDPSYDNAGRLVSVDPYKNQMKPVYECNTYCTCSKKCLNRVVQHGVKCRLQVFVTKEKGLGLKVLQDIKQNTFICEYAGEVLTEKVARKRTELLQKSDSNYILVLCEHFASGMVGSTYVDPSYIGNVGRFINHSCKPNLYMVPVRVECDIPKLALFALKDIKAGEELCYNYSGEINLSQDNIHDKSDINLNSSQYKPCFCGTNMCKGFLPLDPTLFVQK